VAGLLEYVRIAAKCRRLLGVSLDSFGRLRLVPIAELEHWLRGWAIVQAQNGKMSAPGGATYCRGAQLLRGESRKVGEDLAAVRAITPGTLIDRTT
jgi:hypothetical protein